MSRRRDIPRIYYLGRECRRNSGSKLACPFTAITVSRNGEPFTNNR